MAAGQNEEYLRRVQAAIESALTLVRAGGLTREEGERKVEALRGLVERREEGRFWDLYPDKGPLRRDLYFKHLEFFAAGQRYAERCIFAGNRTGKTEAGAYETTAHLTGMYPSWWSGKRFYGPIDAIAAGKKNEPTKGVLQEKLFGTAKRIGGNWQILGNGMIPRERIVAGSAIYRTGYPGLLESIRIKYGDDASGESRLTLKSCEQGRDAFEGVGRHLMWFDEEPPMDVYTEGKTRTMTQRGIVILTFTPLEGMSEVVDAFWGTWGSNEGKHLTRIAWDDVPHWTPAMIEAEWNSLPAAERRTRRYGDPGAGAGRIYDIPFERIKYRPFKMPDSFPRVYCIDPGWNVTAGLWMSIDDNNETEYLYSEYYQGQRSTEINAAAVRARTPDWMPGLIDRAARGSENDGMQTIAKYQAAGLNISPSLNALESGISIVYDRLLTGRLKVSENLRHFRAEYDRYHRDKNGKIPRGQRDHLMACMRYLQLSGRNIARAKPGWSLQDRQMDRFDDDRDRIRSVIGW